MVRLDLLMPTREGRFLFASLFGLCCYAFGFSQAVSVWSIASLVILVLAMGLADYPGDPIAMSSEFAALKAAKCEQASLQDQIDDLADALTRTHDLLLCGDVKAARRECERALDI